MRKYQVIIEKRKQTIKGVERPVLEEKDEIELEIEDKKMLEEMQLEELKKQESVQEQVKQENIKEDKVAKNAVKDAKPKKKGLNKDEKI